MAPKKGKGPPPPPPNTSCWAPPKYLEDQFHCEERTITHLRSGAFDAAHGTEMLSEPGRYRLTFDVTASAAENHPNHVTSHNFGILIGVCDASAWEAKPDAYATDPSVPRFPQHGHAFAWAIDLASGRLVVANSLKRVGRTAAIDVPHTSDMRDSVIATPRARSQPITTIRMELFIPPAADAAAHLRCFAPSAHPLNLPPPPHMLGRFTAPVPDGSSRIWSYNRTAEAFMPGARPSGQRTLAFSVNREPFVDVTARVRLPDAPLYPWVGLTFAADSVTLRTVKRQDE